MRPLERLPTIRTKLGSVIVFAVAMTVMLSFVFLAYALRDTPRSTEVLELFEAARARLNERPQPIPPATMVVYRPQNGPPITYGEDYDVDPPLFDDQQAHWGVTQGYEFVAVPEVTNGVFIGTIYVLQPSPERGLAEDLDATVRYLGQQWWRFAAAGLIAALISLLMARVLALGMTKPLREMAQAAKRMATGDYSLRVHTRSRDEVGQLARAFNKMSDELAGVEQLRRDLVGNVSHELKTPITALRAHLENVLDGVEEPDPKTLQIMVQQSDRLAALVDQLLELSRMEAGDIPLDRVPMALGPLAEDVVAEVRVARGDDVDIRCDVPGELGLVEADPARVHQVLFNLVDNAVRFTPPGGRVRIDAAAEDGSCVVRVSDTGPGIAPEHLPRLFERFYRVDPDRSREGGGTGIGLAIARSVVEAHGGTIRVDSEVGRGSVFTFDLPFVPGEGRDQVKSK